MNGRQKTMKIKNIIRLLGAVLISHISYLTSSFAQDTHFSQYNMTPLQINPALTGFYGSDNRFILNYKNQWSGMGSKNATYTTAMFSYDARLLAKKYKAGYIGAGINAYKDEAGDLKMGTTQLNFTFAGIVYINKKQLISGGIQGGYVQKSLSTSAMKWDSQYDETSGAYNSSLPSGDIASIPPYHYGDFSAGLAWSYSAKQSYMRANNQRKFNLGLAVFHVNRPNQELNPFGTGVAKNLDLKFIAHGAALIGVASSNYEFAPTAAVFMQGTSMEVNVGTMIRWTIKGVSRYTGYVSGMALSLGAQYRVGDAVIPMMTFEYSNYALGVSYDVNTSSLTKGTRGRGGVEISLRFADPNPFTRSSSRLLD